MKMHVLSGGRLRMRKSTYLPDADPAETIELPVSCFLLRHRQANVLFDTGCHPTVAENPEARWGRLARVVVPVSKPGDDVIGGMKGIGVEPDDIDVVVCSHLHLDHCGCNAFFRKATLICHEREFAAAREPGAEARGYLRAEWDVPMPVDSVDAERDLFGDGRIVLLPLPGHTPGSIAALLALDRSGEFLLASDTVSLRANFDRGVLPRNTWNADALLQSWAEVRRIEAGGATVICGHDDVQWRSLRKGPEAYD
jgi:glyoxylase-like metal-dependent hydrolase (beta-lactamase superfamily II)